MCTPQILPSDKPQISIDPCDETIKQSISDSKFRNLQFEKFSLSNRIKLLSMLITTLLFWKFAITRGF